MLNPAARFRIVLWLATFGALACPATIAPFSQEAYSIAVTVKVESLALMQRATEPYANYDKDVQALLLKLQRAYEYAKAGPRTSSRPNSGRFSSIRRATCWAVSWRGGASGLRSIRSSWARRGASWRGRSTRSSVSKAAS